uniref:Uncharacterized protein n=1 Tax=Oryza brachyantha TaxID=4533 RepID=J3NA47_ORYBR
MTSRIATGSRGRSFSRRCSCSPAPATSSSRSPCRSRSTRLPSVIVGVCFGAQWPLLYAIISELFGLRYYSPRSTTWAPWPAPSVPTCSACASTGTSTTPIEAARQHGGDRTCMGARCFREAFLFVTAITVAGSRVSRAGLEDEGLI